MNPATNRRSAKADPAQVSREAFDAARATINTFESQERAAAAHAKAVAAAEAKRNAERADELARHYTAAITDAARNGDTEKLADLIRQARLDATSVGKAVKLLAVRDVDALFGVAECVSAAFGLTNELADCFTSPTCDYRNRTTTHPVYRATRDALQSNTPEAWHDALAMLREYLGFFYVGGGRMQRLKPVTQEGFNMLPRYRAWVADACASLEDARRAQPLPHATA